MAMYLISYDLQKPGQSYTALIDALQKQGAKKVLYSAWVLKTTSTSVQIRDWLRQLTDQNDRLFITEVNNWASYNAITDVNQV